MEKDIELHNNHSEMLCFSKEEQIAINEIIKYCFETYIEFLSLKRRIIAVINTTDFKLLKNDEDFAREYFHYGTNLMWGGITPSGLQLMLENKLLKILKIIRDRENYDIIQLQLLYVKHAVKFIYYWEYDDLLIYSGQLCSHSIPTWIYEQKLKDLNLIK